MQLPPRQLLSFPGAMPSECVASASTDTVSVVLPVYNQANLLSESVSSVLTQGDCLKELIVINDGSTDDVAGALAPFSSDPRLQVIDQENRGLSEALNAGFAATSGAFLTWTSADNRYLPGALARMTRFLLANPAVSMTYANIQLIDDSGDVLRGSNYRRQEQSPSDSSILLLPLEADTLAVYPDNFINACFLYKREVYERIGQHDRHLRGVEDYDYWLRIGQLFQIRHLDADEPFYQYRLHANTMTSTIAADALEEQTRALVLRRRSECEAASFSLERAPSHQGVIAGYFRSETAAYRAAFIRRARSSDFGALSTPSPAKRVLVIPPEDETDKTCAALLVSMLAEASDALIAILAYTPAMRAIADQVNSATRSPLNLRIVDLQRERHISVNEEPFPDPFLRGLMFTLSSVHTVLTFIPSAPTTVCGTLVSALILGALSGRYVIAAALPPTSTVQRLTTFLRGKSESCDRQLPLWLNPDGAPHLQSAYGRTEQGLLRATVAELRAPSTFPPQLALDRWLRENFCGLPTSKL